MSDLRNRDATDALMRMVAYRCMKKEAEEFLALDTSDVPKNPQFEKRILKGIKKRTRKHTPMSIVKIALIACLAVLSLLFTACICIPEVREAMWSAWVEFYDDHMTVTFVKPDENNEQGAGDNDPSADLNGGDTTKAEDTTTENNSSDEPDPPAVTPPTTIEQKALPTYLPEGYYIEEVVTDRFFAISDVYDETNNIIFVITQCPIEKADFSINNENDLVTNIYINESLAVLIEYSDTPEIYTLAWQDGIYAYVLEGSFSSIYEMIKIAESFQLQ